MFTSLRVWWYKHCVKREKWPSDVVEHILRRGWKQLAKVKNITPQKQSEIAKIELAGVLETDGLSPELRGELLDDAMKRLAEIPLEHCTTCKRPVFTYEAKMIDGKPYCESCASEKKH
jgi:hypothetical protein